MLSGAPSPWKDESMELGDQAHDGEVQERMPIQHLLILGQTRLICAEAATARHHAEI